MTTTTTTLSLIQRRQRVRFDKIRDQAYSEILESHDLMDMVTHLRRSECMDICKFNLDCYGLTFKVNHTQKRSSCLLKTINIH